MQGQFGEVPITVRNLSQRGAMAYGARLGPIGSRVSLYLADIGYVKGTLVWVDGHHFGIEFSNPIDHRLFRRRNTPNFGQAKQVFKAAPKVYQL